MGIQEGHENVIRPAWPYAAGQPKGNQQSSYRLAAKFDPNNPANQGNADARVHYLAVHDAYRTLSDPEARRQYDRSLQMQSLTQRVQAERTMCKLSKTLIVLLAVVTGASFYFKHQQQIHADTGRVAVSAQVGSHLSAMSNAVEQQTGRVSVCVIPPASR